MEIKSSTLTTCDLLAAVDFGSSPSSVSSDSSSTGGTAEAGEEREILTRDFNGDLTGDLTGASAAIAVGGTGGLGDLRGAGGDPTSAWNNSLADTTDALLNTCEQVSVCILCIV